MSQQPATSYIALGSNLASPVEQVMRAIDELRQLPDSSLIAISSLYQSAAVGPGQQQDYINAVVALQTRLTPLELLKQLQAIENLHGRERSIRWGARTLDLDILLYDQQQIDTRQLCIPHREMLQRNFVLHPLQEIAPELTLPDGSHLSDHAARCPSTGIEKLAATQNTNFASDTR